MRRFTALVLPLLLAPKALALSMDDLLGLGCSTGIAEAFGMSDACKAAAALQQANKTEGFLNFAKGSLFNASIETIFNRFLEGNSSLAEIKTNLQKFADVILQTYSAPYEFVNGIVATLRNELYEWAYGAITSTYSNIYATLSQTVSSGYQSLSVTLALPEDLTAKFSEAGTYDRIPEGYDSTTISKLQSSVQSATQSIKEVAEKNKDTLLSVTEALISGILPEMVAEAEAKRIEEKAREQVHITAKAAAAKEVGEKAAALSGKVAEIAVDEKDVTSGTLSSVDESKLSLASKYQKWAEDAPSDRELLELQVKAIADLMRNSALMDQLVAEYLRSALEQQVLSTEALREEVRLLRKELVGEKTPAVSSATAEHEIKRIMEEIEAERKRTQEQISPAISAIDGLCQAYGLGSCWESYKAKISNQQSPPQ